MKIDTDVIALITCGRSENLGKTVFVVGLPDEPKLPDLGGAGPQWDVQMVAGPLIGADGEQYLRGKIGAACLTPLNITMDQARAMRENALRKIVEQAMFELFKEEWWGEPPE